MQIEKTYPLSPQQAHLWGLQAGIETGMLPFRVQFLISITGPLDRRSLKEATGEIIRRHEILRTSPADREGAGVLQQVHACNNFVLDEQLLQGIPDSEHEQRIAALWKDSLELPLNANESLRMMFIHCSAHKSFLLVSLSAFCADLKSGEILARQLGQAYAAHQGGGNGAGKAVLQYGDVARWQNELLEIQDLHAGREYWSRLDLESVAVSRLPFQTETSLPSGFVVRDFAWHVPRDLLLRVRHTANKYESSVASFLLACWLVMLGRSSGTPRVVVGVACDGRKYQELQDVIGPLTKFLPVIGSFPEGAAFVNLLAQLDQSIAANCKWQECFSWQHAAPQPSISTFAFQYLAQHQAGVAGGLSFRVEQYWSCMDRFAVWLSCQDQGCDLLLRIHYNARYFQPEEIRLLGERLDAVLESACGRPEAPVSELQLIGQSERLEVVVEFNSFVRPMPGLCVHHLFEQQVERTPGSFAIITGKDCLTYRDLNRHANRLARCLQKHGVRAESRVAILLERSLDMFVAVMAVLKAGAAYVPLDSQHPAERISYVLADAAPALLLTRRDLAENLSIFSGKAIFVDEQREAIAGEDEANLQASPGLECLAYLIYTSGSTGAPKGSMIPHRALLNHALQMIELYDLMPGRRMLQFFSLSFDASAEDIFPSLLSGATLVCPPDVFGYSPSELLAFCRRFEISTLNLPVVLWHQLVQELSNREAALPPHIRMLSVGGESPSVSKLAIRNKITGKRISFRNMYGPTETTITASVYQQDAQTPAIGNRVRVPIGRPLANVPIYLLDGHMEPVPIGVPGEIFVGGVALARGYVNQPGLTAERFVPDPLSEQPGARLYKTGDLGQISIRGEIDFLGRVDHQVKIRGFRVELEEIERTLAGCPAIREAVVSVHENGTGDKRLAAYVTLNQDQSATAKQMRNYLRNRLPEYMFPSWFVVLNSLPLTPTGKLDRRALPVPTNENLGPEQEYVAPRNPTEEIVASIFAELLQVEQVGILDNFFESGGHSLLAVQLASHLREIFQVEVPLKKIFEDPTIAGVTAALLEEEDERLRVERTAELMVKLAAVSDDQAETMLENPLGR